MSSLLDRAEQIRDGQGWPYDTGPARVRRFAAGILIFHSGHTGGTVAAAEELRRASRYLADLADDVKKEEAS